MKVAGFHRSTGSAFFARLNGPYDVYHVLLGVQGVGTGGDDLLGNFLQNSLYNWKMIAMRVVVKPYEGIFTMDDTRSLLYLVQFGTSGTCVLPSMEVFELEFSCGKKTPKHLRLLEPTKTAKALHRILTLKGVGTRIDSMMRFNPPQN